MNDKHKAAITDALNNHEPVEEEYLLLYDEFLTLLWKTTDHGPEDYESVFDFAVKIMCRLTPLEASKGDG